MKWDPRSRRSHATAMREHLLTHTRESLKPYGFNWTFLHEDAALAIGDPIRDQVAQLESLDMDMFAEIQNDLIPPHRKIFEQVLARIKNFIIGAARTPGYASPKASRTLQSSATRSMEVAC